MNEAPDTLPHQNGTGTKPVPSRVSTIRRPRPWLWIGIACGLGMTGIAAWFFLPKQEGSKISLSTALPIAPVVAVKREDLARQATFSAEFRPYQEIAVHAKVAGYVQSISVDIGDHVKQGQAIAQLEIPELRDDLNKAGAATRAAREEVTRADAAFADAALNFTRLSQVAKDHPNLIAQQDLDTAQARAQGAQATLDGAKQEVEAAQANESKMLALLSYSSITAPFDGVVTKRFADTGALVQAGTASNSQAMPLVTLAQENVLRLDFPVNESMVPQVRIGAPVEIAVGSLHRTIHGAVTRVTGQIDPATRTMLAEVDVPNDDYQLTPGMYASATVTLDSEKGALAIPIGALSPGTPSTVLVLGADGRIERRTVTTGLQTATEVQILDGLQESDLVVVARRGEFENGQKAEPKVVAVQ